MRRQLSIKKGIWKAGVLLLSFLATGALSETYAAQAKKDVASPVPVKDSEARRSEAKAKYILAQKDWVIYLTDIAKKGAKEETDVLTFSNGKFTSKNLSNRGYPASDFKFTMQEDDVILWEAVCAHEKGETAFWKAEVKGDAMQGVLALASENGEIQDFSFTTAAQAKRVVQPDKK